jgi:hypothetical protein
MKFAKHDLQWGLAVLISCGIATVFPSLVAAKAACEKAINVLCFTVVVIMFWVSVVKAEAKLSYHRRWSIFGGRGQGTEFLSSTGR